MKRHFVTYNSIAAAIIGGAGAAPWGGNVITAPYLQRETSVSPTANGGDLGT